jgi:splicing factor U2AF subunit
MTQTAKIDRKLYVGNLPTSMTQRMLTDVMNDAMLNLNKTKGWKLEPGPPVVSSWISTDGHYGFIEFRTAEEAHLGFALQGMSYLGSELKIGRPKAYQDADAEDNSMVLPPMSLEEFNPILAATQGISNPIIGGSSVQKLFPINGPTKILQLKDLATFELTNRFERC